MFFIKNLLIILKYIILIIFTLAEIIVEPLLFNFSNEILLLYPAYYIECPIYLFYNVTFNLNNFVCQGSLDRDSYAITFKRS